MRWTKLNRSTAFRSAHAQGTGSGVGTKLLVQLQKEVVFCGKDDAVLLVCSTEAAKSFYREAGFVDVCAAGGKVSTFRRNLCENRVPDVLIEGAVEWKEGVKAESGLVIQVKTRGAWRKSAILV